MSHQEAADEDDAWMLQTRLWLFCRMRSLAQGMGLFLATHCNPATIKSMHAGDFTIDGLSLASHKLPTGVI